MAHITHIKVDHFRALKSVAFSLGKMAVLIGENDVGKTSVLNALRTFYANKKLSDRHDYHLHDLESPVVITITLKNDDSEATFRRTFEFNKAPTTEIEKEGEFKGPRRPRQTRSLRARRFSFSRLIGTLRFSLR